MGLSSFMLNLVRWMGWDGMGTYPFDCCDYQSTSGADKLILCTESCQASEKISCSFEPADLSVCDEVQY